MIFEKSTGNFTGLCLAEIDIEKGVDVAKIGYDAKFKGVASTERLDRQDQILIQKGLNFSPFIEYGYFNDNHGKGTCVAEAIGDKAKYNKEKNCWEVNGRFLPYVQKAKEYVDIAKSFAHNDSAMRLRLSVEGKVVDISEDGKVVKKADVYRVAITLDPINPETHITLLAKSLGQEDLSNSDFDLTPEEEERLLIAGRLAKSMNISIEMALQYFDKYSIK